MTSIFGMGATELGFFQVHPLLTRKWRQRVEKRLKSPGFIGGASLTVTSSKSVNQEMALKNPLKTVGC